MYENENYEKFERKNDCCCFKHEEPRKECYPKPPKPEKEPICLKVTICAKFEECEKKHEPKRECEEKERYDSSDAGYSDFFKAFSGGKDFEYSAKGEDFKSMFEGKKDIWDLISKEFKVFITIKAEFEKCCKKENEKKYDEF